MSPSPGKTYRPWNPDLYRGHALAPADQLPEDDLVFFLLDLVPQLDLRRFYAYYEDETRGAPPFCPTMMVCLLLYAYCVGVFSSRKIALACERNLAFLAIVGLERPDFRTISDFRKIHLEVFPDVFIAVLRLAHELGMVRLGNLSTDGSKFAGNASRHKAMSYGYMVKEEERLRQEIATLLQEAQQQDAAEDAVLGTRRGEELPAELQRREQRLATIQAAKERLEACARAEAAAEQQRRAQAEAERQAKGQKRRGKEPKPVSTVPDAQAQLSFTDPELKVMKQNNKGWEYSANAQVMVDDAFQIIVAYGVTAEAHDKQQGVPLARQAKANLSAAGVPWPTDAAGQPVKIPNTADSGYYSAAAVQGVEAEGFEPYFATERQRHGAGADTAPPATSAAAALGTTGPAPTPAAAGPTAEAAAREAMRAKLRSERGRKLYARRKVIVEPVYGQIKGARGFRRWLLRGLQKIGGEWCLVSVTHNLLKIWRYGSAQMMTKKVAIEVN